MQGFVFTLMALIALYVAFSAFRRPKGQTPQQPRPIQDDWTLRNSHRSAATTITDRSEIGDNKSFTVEYQTEAYDRNTYRFGGYATPEYRIDYADADGVVSTREIYLNTWRSRGSLNYLDCWCFLRDERREFRSDRILSAVNLSTNRRIKDIVAHRSRW